MGLVIETQTETERDRQRQTAFGRSGGSLGGSWVRCKQRHTETNRDREVLAALRDLLAARETEIQTESDRDIQRQTALGRSGGSLGDS